jgi:hypothetical protein
MKLNLHSLSDAFFIGNGIIYRVKAIGGFLTKNEA